MNASKSSLLHFMVVPPSAISLCSLFPRLTVSASCFLMSSIFFFSFFISLSLSLPDAAMLPICCVYISILFLSSSIRFLARLIFFLWYMVAAMIIIASAAMAVAAAGIHCPAFFTASSFSMFSCSASMSSVCCLAFMLSSAALLLSASSMASLYSPCSFFTSDIHASTSALISKSPSATAFSHSFHASAFSPLSIYITPSI